MKWIWERADWPNFTFEAAAFPLLEREFHRNTGLILGSLCSVSSDNMDELRVTLLSNEALDTSKIESEILHRDSVQSSICGHLGLQTDGKRSGIKEAVASRMMVDLYKSYSEPLDQERLFFWLQMLMNGRIDLKTIEGYRVHVDPMQIVSGRLDLLQVFYVAPTSRRVPNEMKIFYNGSIELSAQECPS